MDSRSYRALLQAAPRLVLVWILLPVVKIRRLRRWLNGSGRSETTDSTEFDPDLWAERVRAIRRIGARLPGCHCLARSLTLSWWLDASGIANDLKLGVRSENARTASHSWIEIDGRPIDETPEVVARFKVMDFE